MRKQLMAGTALVAATMLAAGGAVAADKKMMKPSISVNGYYEGIVGGILDEDITHVVTGEDASDNPVRKSTDVGTDTSALDTRTDAEVHFNGRATLDSGVKIHAHWELEGQNNHSMDGSAGGDVIDEYFLSVSGSFGQIILGGTEGAAVKMLTGYTGSWATGVGENLSFDDAWIPTATGGAQFETLRHSRVSSGDGEKITYISPKLGGFQVGATYEPRVANNDDNSRVNAEADRHDAFHMAASYSGKFGDVGFGGGFGMLTAQGSNASGSANSEDMQTWIVAGRMDFGGGFRAAAGYKKTEDPAAVRGYLVDAGVRYIAGANKFSVTGMYGEMDDTEASHTKMIVSYARAMGPGVTWHMNAIWNDSQSDKMAVANDAIAAGEMPEDLDDGTGMLQAEKSGLALVTGIKVVF